METLIEKKIAVLLAILLSFGICRAQDYSSENTIEASGFQWPEGKRMAVSLTFDDGRFSQVDYGIPVLDKYDVKGTFYISVIRMMERIPGWKAAIANGHDIGNHTLTHPCTGNFDWSRHKALEGYTLDRMENELDSSNLEIERVLGIKPVSFAFPCGQTYVGRGTETRSYVPLVAERFETGRTYMDEGPNAPAFCDLAQLLGMKLDGMPFDKAKSLIESEKCYGKWLILVCHETGKPDSPGSMVTLATVEAICKYAADPENGIWLDSVHNIAEYVKRERKKEE